MSEWSEGYVSDVGYTYGYYPELNPQRVRLAFLSSGLVFPKIGTACELGFGQGLSTNIHAAASVVDWYGTDFNPAQAGFAQELAGAAGTSVRLFDQAFDEFASRTDLPDFDYIGLHGIWSWISAENRAVIVDFIKRKLKVGGVLYVSYNTMPGWANFAPVRHLMTQHADIMGAAGKGIVPRIGDALEFTEQLFALNPGFVRANPLMVERIKKIKEQDKHYLAHEYFNRDWDPMPFAEMAALLEPAKLQFACSASALEHIDAINLTTEQLEFLNAIPDEMFRQTVRDFMVNQQFRRDYWVRGARKLGSVERIEELRRLHVVLLTTPADISLAISGAAGKLNLNESIYKPVIDLLADHRPKSLADIELAMRDKGVTLAHLMQVAQALTGMGHMECMDDSAVSADVAAQTARLNAHLCKRAMSNKEIVHLASPITGGGIGVRRFYQMFLAAMKLGNQTPEACANYAWDILASQGEVIVHDGKPLTTKEENLAQLNAEAREFFAKRLPILQGLGIA